MKEYNGIDITALSVDEMQGLCDSIKGYTGIIYCYTNTVNNKKYVGQTRNPKERHYAHIKNEYKLQDRTPLHNAIIKYGSDKFRYEILELCINDELDLLRNDLNDYERQYIEDLQSLTKQHGYNVAIGGQYNRETGPSCPARPVDMYSLNGEYIRSFNSISEAQRFTGMIGTGIRDVCNHLSKTSSGYLWTWKDEEVVLPTNDNEVHQYSLEGEYMASYRTASEACFSVGLKNASGLTTALRDKHRVGAGFYWRRYKADRIPITDFPKAIFSYNLDGSFCRGYITLQDAIDDVNASGASAICAAITRKNAYRNKLWRREYTESIDPYENRRVGNIVIKAIFPDGTEKIYDSIVSASKDTQIAINSIRSSFAGRNAPKTNGVKFIRVGNICDNNEHITVTSEQVANKEIGQPTYKIRKVDQYTIDFEYVRTFSCIAEAEREMGTANIGNSMRNHDMCAGFIWTFHGDPIPQDLIDRIVGNRIYQYDSKGNYVATFKNKIEAAIAIGYASSNSHIGRCIREPWRTAKGYYWRDTKVDKIDINIWQSKVSKHQ